MPNNINLLSPDFRDYLLNRNIISDTIQNNGLDGLLVGIGIPAEVSHSPEAVQPSVSIEIDGVFYKDLNVVQNKYQTDDDGYRQASINYLPGNTNSTIAGNPYNQEPYSNEAAEIEEYGSEFRKFNTIKNNYLDVEKQSRIDFGTQPVPTFQLGSYLDENGNLNLGGPSTQPLDIIGSVLTGGGIGFDPNGGGAVANFDVRSSLAGRVLGGLGVINDTRLGQLGSQYLAAALGNNAAFGLQQETLGRLNLNPLSWLQGNDLFVPNYTITVPKSALGSVLDFGAKVLGFEVPVSILDGSASIFGRENPVDNISRLNAMVLNTGKGQVLALITNLNENRYKPTITDDRKRISITKGDTGTDGELYAFNSRFGESENGGIMDLLNTTSSPGTNSNRLPSEDEYTTEADAIGNSGFESKHGRITSELDLPFNDDFQGTDGGYVLTTYGDDLTKNDNGFIWGDDSWNKATKESLDNQLDDFFDQPKSILFKTQELFKTNRMKTLVSGKGLKVKNGRTQIQSAVRESGSANGFMSKGSGVLSSAALSGELSENASAGEIFCRTWSSVNKYSEVNDLQKHSGINRRGRTNPNQDVEASVLEDTGFVKIGPYKDETGLKKFMFSIENLAWADDLSKLIPCEIGNGDLISGTKGRIMWFPPYEISFNETTSVNWDKNNFIGRGEPIYTYNNAERTGTLSFKIVVDHPNYMNYFPKDWKSDHIASFFAGCLEMEDIQQQLVSDEDKAKIKVAENTAPQEVVDDEGAKAEFNVYFSNDNYNINKKYEDGLDKSGNTINQNNTEFPEWILGGLGETYGDGIVGGKGTAYPDRTDFGLNRRPIDFPGVGVAKDGWIGNDFSEKLSQFIKDKCKYCRIKIYGSASQQGASDKNVELSRLRGETVKNEIIIPALPSDDEISPDKRIKLFPTQALGETGAGCTGEGGQDRLACKEPRTSGILIEYDPELKEEVESSAKPIDEEESKPVILPNPGIFFTECNYFEKVKESDPFIYSEFQDKIKNFHPAFHSITPEGFNSRLTFLQQCTRQGPTKVATGDLKQTDAEVSNLAFGRPPVCILRIGDFYHTKIIIDNLTIDYEPLVWDLNPEGIGVQPMIANVTISFAFIGGSSLKGPINRLQNAVSFNFFANAEIYDPRAVRIARDANKDVTRRVEGQDEGGELILGYSLVEGTFPDTNLIDTLTAEERDGIGTNTNEPVTNQEAVAEEEATNDNTEGDAQSGTTSGTTATTINNDRVIQGLTIKSASYDIEDEEFVNFDITYGFNPVEADDKLEVDKGVSGRISVRVTPEGVGGVPEVKAIGNIRIAPNTSGSNVNISDSDPSGPIDITVKEFKTRLELQDESVVTFLKKYKLADLFINVQWDNQSNTTLKKNI
jgi:outer membrane protein OmpA-like peptidoglycan-associated protein